MKRYFLSGKEITEQEANEIEKRNQEYLQSEDMNDWKKCQFIICISR